MPGLVLLVFISCYLVSVPAWAQRQTGVESQRSQEVRPQPGATQAGPTSDLAPAPKFNPDYFVGEWTFDGALAESPLGEGGPRSGTEIVRKGWDGRLWEIAITGEGPDGAPFTGDGIFLFEDSFFAGQSFMRYEVNQGLPPRKSGHCRLRSWWGLYRTLRGSTGRTQRCDGPDQRPVLPHRVFLVSTDDGDFD